MAKENNHNKNSKTTSDGSKKSNNNYNNKNTSSVISKTVQDKYLRDLHRHFRSLYGEDRWSTLSKILEQPTRHVALVNPFVLPTSSSSSQHNIQELLGSGWEPLVENMVWYCPNDDDDTRSTPQPRPLVPRDGIRDSTINDNQDANTTNNNNQQQQQQQSSDLLLSHYLLDGASLLPPLALLGGKNNNNNNHHQSQQLHYVSMLDLCAAPGGKSLVLYYLANYHDTNHISTPTTTTAPIVLCSNEVNKNRRTRLRRVLESYIPQNSISEFHPTTTNDDSSSATIQVSSIDGRQWDQPIDAILVDAPCSSERHILQSRAAPWSLGKVKKEASLQRELLETAMMYATQRVVYSTCSIAEQENDQVVLKTLERMERKYNIMYTIVDPIQPIREQLQWMKHSNMSNQNTSTMKNGDTTTTTTTTDTTTTTTIAAGAEDEGDDETILCGVERTRTGAILLPDRGFGWGPIFWAVLDRVTPPPPLLSTELVVRSRSEKKTVSRR